MTRPKWHCDYDAAGNQIDQVDPKGNVTSFTYDEQGRQVSRMLPGGETETFTYNQYGQQAE